jgi:hypothetical protein
MGPTTQLNRRIRSLPLSVLKRPTKVGTLNARIVPFLFLILKLIKDRVL